MAPRRLRAWGPAASSDVVSGASCALAVSVASMQLPTTRAVTNDFFIDQKMFL